MGIKRHYQHRICHLGREDTTLRFQKVVRLAGREEGNKGWLFFLLSFHTPWLTEPRCMWTLVKI